METKVETKKEGKRAEVSVGGDEFWGEDKVRLEAMNFGEVCDISHCAYVVILILCGLIGGVFILICISWVCY
ncbi:MAG: hypothetical protein U1D98_03140 [Candidatus Gracilibacteria bacterium]|nr:hypothetical protein [Candidatus Gracilibacteria bacterium]